MTAFNSARAEELGAELREARIRAGLTQTEVAARLQRSHSHISKWERGRLLPSVADTAAMLALYDVTGDEREQLVAMARQAADADWVVPGTNRRLAALIASEKAARRIVHVEPQLIPGLCQTQAYAREIMAGADVTRDQLEQRVHVRLDRQAVLTQDEPPEYVAVIGEFALRYPPCDPVVMAEQLRKLLELCRYPNVSIFVLPLNSGNTPALLGSFALIEPRRGDPTVRQERYRATAVLANRRDVRDYQSAVDEILRKAMSVEASAAFIGRLLKEIETKMERGE